MKIKKDENYWSQDNGVEISRKNRVCRDSYKISKKYAEFSPEDLSVDMGNTELNPSVNKYSWKVSEYLDEGLDYEKYKLKKNGDRGKDQSIDEAFEYAKAYYTDTMENIDEE